MATIERYSLADGKPRYQVRYRTPNRTQTKKRGFRTRREAELYAATVEVAKARGEYIAPVAGRVTVGEIYTSWAATRSPVKETTKAKATSIWSAHVEQRWASELLKDVTPAVVRTWAAELTAGGAGAATVENVLGLLRSILGQAVVDRQIPTNPAEGIKAPRRTHSQRGYLTHDQVAMLAKETVRRVFKGNRSREIVVDNPGFETLIFFLAYTGLRWGEMAALKVGSFDMRRRRISVTEAYAEVSGRLVLDTAKNHERRSVPFPAFLLEPLAGLMAGKAVDELVFTGPLGAALRVNTFRRRQFAPAVARCQAIDSLFPTVTPHDLRHTAASLAISVGANVKSVQTMLGHKSAAMTLDVYADLFPDDLDAVAIALDQAVSTRSGTRKRLTIST
jgi:integrase